MNHTSKDILCVSDTTYTIHFNESNSYNIIDIKLFKFNKSRIPATQKPEIIDKNFIIKDGNKVIAGICADIYIWKILYISLLFVEDKYRHQGLGTLLLKKVEEEAKKFGVKLAHLDTFDFQAKDFYCSHGYEVFGTLDNCPEGHKRYYMKKIL